MREGNFPTIEKALMRYIRECARYMNNYTLFRGDVIKVKALEVRDEILLDHGKRGLSKGDHEALQQFKGISDCVANFMKTKNYTSKRAIGDDSFTFLESL